MKHILPLLLLALSLVGCENATLILSSTNINLYYGQMQTLTVMGGSGKVTWTTTNDFVATIENGTIWGNHIGECVISAKSNSGTASCRVTVSPRYFTYTEPILDWGMTFDRLQEYKGKYDSHTTNNGKDLYYYLQDEDKGIIEVYTFGNGILENSAIMLNIKNTDVTKFLLERYQSVPYDGKSEYVGFINSTELENATLGVGLKQVTSSSKTYFLVMYFPYSNTES